MKDQRSAAGLQGCSSALPARLQGSSSARVRPARRGLTMAPPLAAAAPPAAAPAPAARPRSRTARAPAHAPPAPATGTACRWPARPRHRTAR
eukprot:234254-Prymnesium_polylepis.1